MWNSGLRCGVESMVIELGPKSRSSFGILIVVPLLFTSCGRPAISAQSTPVGSSTATASSPADRSCATTRAPDPPFVPPAPYSRLAPGDQFWYGTPALWTALPRNGAWLGLPREPAGYSQKVFRGPPPQGPAGRESDTVAGLRGLHPTARPRGLCALWTRAGRASLDFGFRARRSGNSRSAFSR